MAREFKARGEVQELKPEWKYVVKVNTFYPEAQVSTGQRQALSRPKAVKAKRYHEEDYIAFRWQDVGPSEIRFHDPLSRVEVRLNEQWVPMVKNGEAINDDGYDIEVRYLKRLDDGMGEYEVRWYNPVPGGKYRFAIEPRCEHSVFVSRAFIYRGFADGQDTGAALLLAGEE